MPRGSQPKHVNARVLLEDSPRKWYVLGLSYVSYSHYTDRQAELRNIWQSTSPEVIEKVKSCLEIDNAVSHTKNKHIDPSREDYFVYRLSTTSPSVYTFMKEQGLHVPKRERTFPEQVPLDLLPHFLRGFFDAKAALYHDKEGLLVCTLSYNPVFLEALAEKLKSQTAITKQRGTAIRTRKKYSGRNAFNIRDYLYQDLESILQGGLYVPERKDLFFRK